MPSVFLIGGTGHVGGAVLDQLQTKHSDVPVKVLVRSEPKATRLRTKYPRVQTVLGDLSTWDVVKAECRRADIVLNCAPDITHESSIKAAVDSMCEPGRKQKGFFVQTTGASNLYDEPTGSPEARTWDDMDDIKEIMNFSPTLTHVKVDNILRDASEDVYVANISPGGIGGISPSIEHPVPLSTGAIVTTARAFNSGFKINTGENQSGWVHVLDLARAFLLLVDNALASLNSNQPPAEPAGFPLWGREAYYYPVAEQIAFRDLIAGLIPPMRKAGIIESTEIVSTSSKDAARVCLSGTFDFDPDMKLPAPDSWQIHMAVWLGVNMRIQASRLTKLGWKPREVSILDTLADVIPQYLAWEKEQSSS
ncbi:Uu.00g122580.m01.CDS01 [Anthostomella pinea]|uniref:Uu.00g122580.m01.CDS01 n=1 Tax=Anthostomella pinea TaxID=933095 RepID=A0AAI8VH51_9PEZI|nr:Uu.00g122580.m01.CDS01 [Anthostomella pinea]